MDIDRNHPNPLDQITETRLMGALKGLAELLEAHGVKDWADRFRKDLNDYLEARGTPHQDQRKMVVVIRILTLFGGLSDFGKVVLFDETGNVHQEANERLRELASQLWVSARSMQAAILSHGRLTHEKNKAT